MRHLRINSANYEDFIRLASEEIKNSKIVAYPTETFYGLGVRYDDEDALRRLYSIKKRPADKTMPLIIGEFAQLSLLVDSTNEIEQLLIKEFWHGPLTILFHARDGLSEFIVKDKKVAVRLPSCKIARDISILSNLPITSTSANISSMPPPMDAMTILRYFGDNIDVVVDDGFTPGGMPSTIVEVSNNAILVKRHGILNVEKFCLKMGIKLIRNQ
ncbi:MAG: L-threonylcarbamoyladenylate synthase [Thermodesulfovibrionales bacterium]